MYTERPHTSDRPWCRIVQDHSVCAVTARHRIPQLPLRTWKMAILFPVSSYLQSCPDLGTASSMEQTNRWDLKAVWTQIPQDVLSGS